MFEYFYKQNKELTLLDLNNYFDNSDYKELTNVISPLLKQNLISQPRYQVWGITDIGRKEYLRKELETKTKKREDWYKRNWLLADIIKYVIGAIVGAAITATTLLTCNPKRPQVSKSQYHVLFQDTLSKKKALFFLS